MPIGFKPMTTTLRKTRIWGVSLVAIIFGGFAICTLLACATEVFLMNNRTANQVIFCIYPSSTRISLEYINPYMSQRILKPSLNPPCVAVPWSSALPQSGSWKFPP
jgi:hypothetical protein